jgi:hypothetical protein
MDVIAEHRLHTTKRNSPYAILRLDTRNTNTRPTFHNVNSTTHQIRKHRFNSSRITYVFEPKLSYMARQPRNHEHNHL